MFYKLSPELSLRGWDKLPYAVVKKGIAQPEFISAEQFKVLDLCNGAIDVDAVLIDKQQKQFLQQLTEQKIVVSSDTQDKILPKQEYHKYPARYIQMAHWSITGKCNYRCKHCYMSAPDAKYGELSHEECIKIIDEFAECGVRNISITGGEPLVRKDFWQLVDYMLEKELNIPIIYSNGKLVTDELLDEFEKRGIYPEFNMSFDGVGWHDWLRGIDGAEKYAVDAFTRCHKRGFPTGAEMCLHQKNKHTLRESVNLLAKLGCEHLKTNPVADVGAWLLHSENNSLTLPELYELYLDYIPHYFKDGAPLDIMLGGFFMGEKGSNKYIIPSKKFADDCNPDGVCICGHARLVMYISADGHALPCMALSGMDIQDKFPNVTETGLQKALTDSFYMDTINITLKDYLDENSECAECAHRHICGGGCRASALQGSVNYYSKDPATCLFFKGGYEQKIEDCLNGLVP